MAELEPQFEITILKRKLKGLIDDCKEYLTHDIEHWGKERKFDKFVTDLTKIREEVRLTYLVVVDKSLRAEAEIQKVIEESKQLSDAYEEYKTYFDTIQQEVVSTEQASKRIAEMQSESEGLYSKASEAAKSIADLEATAEASYEFVSKYENEAKERTKAISDLQIQLQSMEKSADRLIEGAEQSGEEYERLEKSLTEQIELNKEQQQEIQNTLENANRAGMAGSFKSRKDELNFPIKVWGTVFVVAVILIFAIGYHFVAPYVKGGEDVNYFEITVKVLLVSPFVWLAWMSVKQYGYLSRIREDYAYKFASAMAFEGYKKHAIELDEKLLRQLLEVSIENLSQNPIRLFGAKDNHASPAHEGIKELVELLKSAKDKVKATSTKDKPPVTSSSDE